MTQNAFILPSVHVVDPRSPFHGHSVDVFIKDGQIQAIDSPGTLHGAPEVDWAKGIMLSPGWIDSRARSGAPGHEERETYDSLAAAALRGGFTHVALMPSTHPVRDNRPAIEALPEFQHVVWIPVGALTQEIGRAHV